MAKDSLQLPANLNLILFLFIEIYPGKLNSCSFNSQFGRNPHKLSEDCTVYHYLLSVKYNPADFLPKQ